MEFLQTLENTAFLTWVRESGSLLGYPTILFLHTIGLATVAGVSSAISLRLLGFADRMPLSALRSFYPIIWIAFAVTALSGTTLLLADATTKLASPVFYVKMLLIALALGTMQVIKKGTLSDPRLDTVPLPGRAKLLGLASLFLWVGATMAGRLMAYLGPMSGLE